MRVSKNVQQNNSETVTNDHDKEIAKERYVSPEERQEIIDEQRLKQYNNEISKNHKYIQRQLQMNKKRYIYLQKKSKKLLII